MEHYNRTSNQAQRRLGTTSNPPCPRSAGKAAVSSRSSANNACCSTASSALAEAGSASAVASSAWIFRKGKGVTRLLNSSCVELVTLFREDRLHAVLTVPYLQGILISSERAGTVLKLTQAIRNRQLGGVKQERRTSPSQAPS